MVQGRGRVDGAMRWLAGAVRTLQKEMRELKDLLEECHSYKNQLKQVRADPALARVYGSVYGSWEGYVVDGSGGNCVPPSTLTPSCPRQLGSPFSVDDDLDSRAPPLLLTSSFAKQFGSSSDVDDDLQDVENIPPSAHTPSCLTQLGSSFDADDDVQNVDNILTPVQCPQLQFKEGNVEIPENRFDQGLKVSDSLGTAPGRNATLSEIVEVVKLESPLPAESASPMFVTAPVVEVAPDMVEYIQFASVAEYVAPVQTETADFVTPTPVFESVQVLQVQAVEKIIEIPHMQIIEKIVEIPEFQTVQAVDETTYESVTGGHTPNLVPIPSYLREFGASFYADDDLRDVENIPLSAHTPSCLMQLGSSFGANDGLQNYPVSVIEKVSGSNGDTTASSLQCRSHSQTLQDMYDNPVMGMSPKRGNDLDQTSTVSLARTRINDSVDANASFCVPRQKVVREFDISDSNPRVCSQNSAGELDCENLTACNRDETAIVRHVSFAENVEVVEFNPAVHATLSPVVEYDAPAPNMAYRPHTAPSPMVEYNAPLMSVHHLHAAPAPTFEYDAALMMAHQAYTTSAPMAEYDAALTEEYDAYAEQAAPSPLMDGPVVKVVPVPQVQIAEKTMEITQFQTIEEIVDIPEIQTLEAVLHELELGCYDLEEISYMACMNRMRTWRRAWHSSPNPLDASKSERSWRRLSKNLCYEEEFDVMKRTCAYCGRFEDDDDVLVPCQGSECSLRSNYGIPGVFHGHCAEALGYSGSVRWQNCPWCQPTVITAPNVECLPLMPEVRCAASASWTTPFINAAVENENGLNPDDIKLVMLQVNCSRSKAVSALRDSNNDLIEAVTQCLSTAMLDELVEDFDKPGGIGAMIDKSFERFECFEKFDQPNKKLKSDEGVADENGLEPGDIELVMSHANCSRFKAVSALRANSNNMMDAIIMLCLEKEDTVMQAENSDIIGTDGKRIALRKKRQRRRQRTAT